MPTVFLSSVASGMEAYRDNVCRAIERLDGHHCVRMEDFGARDEASDEFCRCRVAQCDLFVLLLGHQYGSCPRGSDQSYTEREYQAAVGAGIKRLVFLAKENFPVQAHLIETDEMRERQRKFRERVKQDRAVAFFNPGDPLGELVLGAIHNTQNQLGQYPPPADHTSGKTWLLFPFVTSQMGFDTGIVISNVSADPIGTTHQAGTIKLFFYGVNAPTVFSTTYVPPGGQFTQNMATIGPFFQGYMVAQCNFYPARGSAFVSDVGVKRLLAGYIAEIMKVETG